MERGKESLIFLDTHIVLWLYDALLSKFTLKAKRAIDAHDVCISPLVELELQFLFEVGKITEKPSIILEYLSDTIGLCIHKSDFFGIVKISLLSSWTRDPFDRLIAAEAKYNDAPLISADRNIAEHCDFVIW